MTNYQKHKILTILIATVWLVSRLFCKVLNFVPRHEQIVSRILGAKFAGPLTVLIGLLEIIMAVWVVTGFKSRLNAIIQMVIIAAMNILEFILAPDLLLWGRLNIVFAFMFIGVIYYNEFALTKKISQPSRI